MQTIFEQVGSFSYDKLVLWTCWMFQRVASLQHRSARDAIVESWRRARILWWWWKDTANCGMLLASFRPLRRKV